MFSSILRISKGGKRAGNQDHMCPLLGQCLRSDPLLSQTFGPLNSEPPTVVSANPSEFQAKKSLPWFLFLEIQWGCQGFTLRPYTCKAGILLLSDISSLFTGILRYYAVQSLPANTLQCLYFELFLTSCKNSFCVQD